MATELYITISLTIKKNICTTFKCNPLSTKSTFIGSPQKIAGHQVHSPSPFARICNATYTLIVYTDVTAASQKSYFIERATNGTEKSSQSDQKSGTAPYKERFCLGFLFNKYGRIVWIGLYQKATYSLDPTLQNRKGFLCSFSHLPNKKECWKILVKKDIILHKQCRVK